MHIRLDDVCTSFDRGRTPVLDAITLDIAEGEHVVLLGPSGSGKTTLLRCLLGAVRPDRGTLRIGGLDPADPAQLRTIRRRAGVVRQGNDLVLGLTARTNALLGTAHSWGVREWAAVLRGGTPKRFAERMRRLAENQGITPQLRHRVENLSGGQRQRVALVRAVLPAPSLLLADEPTSGLDPVTSRAAVDTLREAEGVTVVVSTHDLAVARQFPRIVALREGRVCFDGAELTDRAAERIYRGAAAGAEVPA
ncbi:phosphonate ABC transporter ATP-binding protein [Streptomyces aidingensis]|uniref:Phosphonate transport system ATP-binding protein/lipoprotein-releasing system ATP-binding protein n=1 Tax=Streptomyces aidingensis TaxID=910347 RepID=A0A1I1NH03_9ACTN|nr:ATP-binding cassette domain-containing protein [Streptomyces aidingensis]SFC93020.1 phosphonate transport system ATP-binding protein/lipoprotein-releasing system ATP-binding protein [Streptomyces aidingensis]